MKLGANDVSGVKIGATDVNKVYLGSNLVWQAGDALLLDDYPNAAAAYSLRKLRTAYSDSAIRVRRSTDNAEQDIGFVNNELDTASLSSFAGSNNAYVTTWYDQSGNGNDATQSTASKQPIIVTSGVVAELNAEPTMTFSSPFLMELNLSQYPFTSGGSATEKSIFAVALNNSTVNQNLYNIADGRDIYALTYNRSGNNTYGFLGANYGAIGGNITGQNIISSLAISPSSETFNNSVDGVDSNLVRANFNIVSLGSRGGSYTMDGNIQEIVMYESNQSANRTAIEQKINSHYNVYWDGSQTGILDDYTNAEAAYSLRALNSAYTGSAIRVRRSSDNAEQDIGLLYDGSLDTTALLSFVGASNGFISKWYDQSGSGNDATQSTASSQPKIVSSGILELLNGKPSVNFINTGDKINLNSTITVSSNFTVFNSNAYSNINYIYGSDSPIASGLISGGTAAGVNGVSVFSNPEFLTYNDSETAAQKLAVLIQNEDTNIDVNNANLVSNSNIGSIYVESIGNRAPTRSFSVRGNIQECIFFSDDKLETKGDIETNINDYYNVY